MNELEIIDEREVLGKQLRIYGDFENPLFLAKDVAEWIDYDKEKVGQMLNTVDIDEKITSPIYYSGQVRNMWFVTEDGLYEVLMQSRKSIAKQWKKKVKAILKSIRKNGGYIVTKENDTPEMIMARAVLVAEKTINEQKEKIKILAEENNIEVYQPKSLRNEETIEKIKKINPDIIVVVAYGKILPKEVLEIPKYGCINVHRITTS